MPIVPAVSELIRERSAITLALYARLVPGVNECGLFGVTGAGAGTDCGEIWSKGQREMLLHALADAQEEIEGVLGYLLNPEWIVGTLAGEPYGLERFVDAQPWRPRLLARWGQIIEAGQRAEAVISAGAAVVHTSDPATVGPIATTVTDPREIRVYHPGTDVEIDPGQISIAGGNVTISIPRCRLVTAADWDNPLTGLDYTDTAPGGPFEQTVDVVRVYNDPSANAVLVYPHACASGLGLCGCACEAYQQTACLYVVNGRIGALDVRPAEYSDGAWRPATVSGICRAGCWRPDQVRLYYRAGLLELTRQQQMAIIRLAHSKMPEEPCGCDITKSVWAADRNVPPVLTAERINCKFGLSDGAWFAWKQAQAMRLVRGGVL